MTGGGQDNNNLRETQAKTSALNNNQSQDIQQESYLISQSTKKSNEPAAQTQRVQNSPQNEQTQANSGNGTLQKEVKPDVEESKRTNQGKETKGNRRKLPEVTHKQVKQGRSGIAIQAGKRGGPNGDCIEREFGVEA